MGVHKGSHLIHVQVNIWNVGGVNPRQTVNKIRQIIESLLVRLHSLSPRSYII